MGCVADSGMLGHLEADRFAELMSQIRSLILATDIARQAEFIAQFQVSSRRSAAPLVYAICSVSPPATQGPEIIPRHAGP